MPTPESPPSCTQVPSIKLPKITFTKIFRIRSASKDKIQHHHQHNYQHQGKNAEPARQDSNQKYRSNSLKTSNKSLSTKKSLKSIRKKISENSRMEDDSVDVGSCRFNSKYSNHNNVQAMQKQHERNMQKLNQIARLFDPTMMMKLGHAPQDSHPKQNRHKNIKAKEQMRLNQFIFQGKHSNRVRNGGHGQVRNGQTYEIEEYWRKVNESLILAPCKTMENQVSKDLREIYETLVTE